MISMSLEDTCLESEKRTPRQAKCLTCNLTQTWSRVSAWTYHSGPLRKVGCMTCKFGILSTNDLSLEPCLLTTPVVFSWETFGIDCEVGYGPGGLGCQCLGRRSRFAQSDCSALTEEHSRVNHEVNPCCSDEQNQPSPQGCLHASTDSSRGLWGARTSRRRLLLGVGSGSTQKDEHVFILECQTVPL